MSTDFYVIWHILYWDHIQHRVIDLPTSPTQCCCTTLEKSISSFQRFERCVPNFTQIGEGM